MFLQDVFEFLGGDAQGLSGPADQADISLGFGDG